MKAIRVHQPGGPEAMGYEEVPDLVPKSGEALVRIEAVGVNFIDVYHRSGLYKVPFPMTPGQEAAGTVAAVGPDVSGVRPGDRVAYAGTLGAYAELAAVPAARLVPLPASISFPQAAAAMLQGMTAHYLACSAYPVMPGDVCLVHAGAGGIGALLCQIVLICGGRVIATVSSEEKARRAREAGAAETINYTTLDFATEVKRITDGRGVAVVYDGVGKATFEKGLECLAPRGSMVLYGQASGPVAPIDPQVLNKKGSLYLTRPTLAHYTAERDELLWRAGDVMGWIREGKLKLHIFREMPLGEAAEAHRLLESRQTTGKLLLIP